MTVAVRGARRVFRRRRDDVTVALAGVDVSVAAGELVVVVGPSGSGKTTLLRTIAGLDPLESGTVEVGGVDVTAMPPGKRDLAMVFQEFALLPHLTALDNIGFGERARGGTRTVVERKALAAAEILDLGPLLGRRPHELSGGERQRVALARAIVREPVAFLLDEPFSSLDPELRLRARAEVRALQRRLGVAMLYVTHDQHEAMALADRIVVLRAGKVEQVASPEDLFERPANAFVARFASPLPMNLIPVAVLGREGTGVVGVRPEQLRLAAVGAGRLDGRVSLVEPAGDQAIAHVEVTGAPADVDRVLVRTAWADRPREGDDVSLTWHGSDEHSFLEQHSPEQHSPEQHSPEQPSSEQRSPQNP